MESTKKRNYLIATIFIALIIGIWAYRNHEEKKQIESFVNQINKTNSLVRSNNYNESGFSKDSLGDFKGAIEDFTESIRINPNSFAYYGRGLAKYDLEDYRGAISDCNKSIEIDSNYSAPYVIRGMSKYLLNEKESACLDFNKAAELDNSVAYDLIKKHCN